MTHLTFDCTLLSYANGVLEKMAFSQPDGLVSHHRGNSNSQQDESAGVSQDDEQPGPSRRERQPSMSETMPLYTLCKEDLESMDKEVSVKRQVRSKRGWKSLNMFIISSPPAARWSSLVTWLPLATLMLVSSGDKTRNFLHGVFLYSSQKSINAVN